MILSVITINNCYCDKEEMLIPKVIGSPLAGYSSIRRLDRILPVGHRMRGDVNIYA